MRICCGVVNAGHQRNGAVIRTAGDDHEPRKFSVFAAPLVIAAIRHLPGTIEDRSDGGGHCGIGFAKCIAVVLRPTRRAAGQLIATASLIALGLKPPTGLECPITPDATRKF